MPPYESEDDDMIAGLYGLTIDDGSDDAYETRRPQPLPLTGVKVEAKVLDFISEVKLSQCYQNDSNQALEVIYHFPIYEGAAVCGFEAQYEDGSVVKGLVKEKEAAKREYKKAKHAGKQANLLESVRRDIFSLKVGNLPAGGFVKISITYVASLEARDDAAAFVLPTSIAPRYIPPASPTTKAETQALSPPQSTFKLFGLDVCIEATCMSEIKAVTCPTHTQDLSVALSGKSCHASLQNIALDRDVVVLIAEEKCHQPRACIEVAEDGETMTGLVTFYPRIEFCDLKRDFVFVIDRSGSMMGSQIKKARDTLLLFLRSLPTGCTFNIIGFGSRYEALFDGPQPYNDSNLERASQYATALNANFGGTEILQPLRYVFGQPAKAGVERQIFVLTDGQVSNDAQVFDLIRQHCNAEAQACRLFSVGIGSSVSRQLVSGMARAGRGTSCFVEDSSSDALRGKVLGQLKQSLQPALDDVSVEWKFSTEETKPDPPGASPPTKTLLGYRSPSIDRAALNAYLKMYPSVNPPIFNKEKYFSFAMFPAGAKPESVLVKCATPDGPLEVCLDISSEEYFTGSTARKLAARTAITEYEDQSAESSYRSFAPAGCISKSEALELALANGLVSKQTAFIAVSGDSVVDPGVACGTKVIPQQTVGHSHVACAYAATPRYNDMNFESMAMLCDDEDYLLGECDDDDDDDEDEDYGMIMQRSRAAAAAPSFKEQARSHFVPMMAQGMEKRSGGSRTRAERKRGGTKHTGSSKAVAPPTSDKLLQLCVLQKADGSFVLDQRLVEAVGMTREQVDEILARLGSPDSTVFATALAVVVLRLEHAKKRHHWELQEQKALELLESRPGSADLIANVEVELRKLQSGPGPK